MIFCAKRKNHRPISFAKQKTGSSHHETNTSAIRVCCNPVPAAARGKVSSGLRKPATLTLPMAPSTLLFTAAEWTGVVNNAVMRMAAKVEPHTTPISQVIDHDNGDHWGAGSYCEFEGKRFLLTNEHVAAKLQTHSLAHKFHGDDHYFQFRHQFHAIDAPNDTALVRIDDREWTRFPHGALPIAAAQFATIHAPVEWELLFVAGYSGERAKFLYGSLFTRGTPYLARECPLPVDPTCVPEFHFAMHYNPALATPVDPKGRPLPLPPGMSGSLVWNTRVVEQRIRCLVWTPDDAVVTGILWGWPSDTCVVATKVEHMQLRELVQRAGG